MSNLLDALKDTRSVLRDLERGQVFGARRVRTRIDLLERAAMMLELRPRSEMRSKAVAKLARDVLNDAIDLQHRHRTMQYVVSAMMD